MSKQSDFLDKMLSQLEWTRAVFTGLVRETNQESTKAGGQETAERLQEYRELLRDIVLDIGELINRINVDREVDNPGIREDRRAYKGGKQ